MALSKNFCQERRSLMDKALALRSQSPGLDSRRVRVYCPKRRGEERGDPGGPGLCVRPACEACEACEVCEACERLSEACERLA